LTETRYKFQRTTRTKMKTTKKNKSEAWSSKKKRTTM